jgi:hypothetical protein
MKKEQFISALTELCSGCTPESAEMWTQFAKERVEAEQFVEFAAGNPDGDEAAIEDWLDSVYAGISLVRQRFNEDISLQVANLAILPFCLYPYEMYAAAKHFAGGGKPEDIPDLNEKDLLVNFDEENWPMFPKPETLSDGTDCEESSGMTMQ